MATNKTRIAFIDVNNAGPYGQNLVLEFDIYQDAIDYIETFCTALVALSTDWQWACYVYSYDNPSYYYYDQTDTLRRDDITFPNLI